MSQGPHDGCSQVLCLKKSRLEAGLLPFGTTLFPAKDLNLHKQSQSLLCYHYTSGDRMRRLYQAEAACVKLHNGAQRTFRKMPNIPRVIRIWMMANLSNTWLFDHW